MEPYKRDAISWLDSRQPDSLAPYEIVRKFLREQVKDLCTLNRGPIYYQGALVLPTQYPPSENKPEAEEVIEKFFEEVFTVYLEREKVRAYLLRLQIIYEDHKELPECFGGESPNEAFLDPEMSLIRRRLFLCQIL